MKAKTALAFFCVATLASSLRSEAQNVVENAAKPPAKNAFRLLELKEVFRISDDAQGRFYFMSPRDLKVAADGSFIVMDTNQLLHFAPDGRFLKNLHKKGQGPGELGDWFEFAPGRDGVFVKDMHSRLVFKLNWEGQYVKELRRSPKEEFHLYGEVDGGLIFLRSVEPLVEAGGWRLLDMVNTIILVSKDGSTEKELGTFPTKIFLAPGAGMEWASFTAALSDDHHRMYVSHTLEYLVSLIDIDKGMVVRKFKRPYPSVRHRELPWEAEDRKRSNAPEKKFDDDIRGLFPNARHLWVLTSTQDKDKGDLIDVFTNEGRFFDSFFLGPGRTLLKVEENDIFVLEKDNDENWILLKYRIK